MGHRAVAFATTEVKLAEGYWAKVRSLTGDEAIAVGEAITGGPVTSLTASREVQLNNRAFTAAALSAFIVEWNVDDDNNVVLPINEQTVMSELNALEQNALMAVYRKLNQPLQDEAARSEQS